MIFSLRHDWSFVSRVSSVALLATSGVVAIGCGSAAEPGGAQSDDALSADSHGSGGGTGSGGGGSKLFISSAVEHADGTVTLPLHRGTSHGQNVYYVVLDASDGNVAQQMGSNTSQKLGNARGTSAVQHVTSVSGSLVFPATVDFSPVHVLTAPGPFPPAQFAPGAVGEAGYSPLVQMPDGTVMNAPQLARDQNGDGRIDLVSEAADKVISIDLAAMRVTYLETQGFARGNAVHYASTDSSSLLAAALEDVTYAPSLDAAPSPGDDSTASSRASLIAFVNGQTGVNNPQRQGLNSAVLGDGSPFNVLAWTPNQGRYSPLWDVNLARWTDATVAAGANLRQTEVAVVQQLAQNGQITAPDGTPLGASNFIVDCPIISQP